MSFNPRTHEGCDSVSQKYKNVFQNVEGIRYLEDIEGVKHNYSYFPIFIDENGAVQALQDAGFNLPHSRTIPVFGFGNAPDVQEFLTSGSLSGTVRTDETAMTDALFTVLQTVCGKHTIAHAFAVLSSDSRFYITEDCLSRLCLTCYPVA